MPDEPDLFDDFPPYARGSDTSFGAAASKVGETAGDRKRVFDVIRSRGDATCDEIEIITGLPHQNVSARIWELKGPRYGWIVDTGRRRQTRTGRLAAVYKEDTAA
jgi:hypothetical protein